MVRERDYATLPPLTAKQEQLVLDAQKKLMRMLRGDPKVKNLVNAYDDFEDAVQEGWRGLVEAVHDFDESLGNQFWTFAWFRVRMRLQRGVRPGAAFLMVSQASANKTDNTHRKLHRCFLNGDHEGDSMPSALEDMVGHQDVDLDAAEDRDRVEIARQLCTRKEFFVIRSRSEGYTLREIGAELGISKERVRQIQRAATDKLQRRFQLKEAV